MNELSQDNIINILLMVRNIFPFTHIIDVFKNITGDLNLDNFSNIKKFQEQTLQRSKAGIKISKRVVEEMSIYFTEDQKNFLIFLASLSSQGIKHEVVTTIALDDFITKINSILSANIGIIVESGGRILKWVPNKAEKDIFLNISVPDYICDYFIEGLDCSSHGLYRSSILFCTFSLEAALRFKYAELISEKRAYEIKFTKLIDWGIDNNLIEENDFYRASIDFIREYRNDLAHCNINKPDAKRKISRSYAQKMSKIVINLVELFINNMFYK